MKLQLAKNPHCPIDVLEALAKDEDQEVRYWVAGNPNTPTKTLEFLSKDKNYEVRQHVTLQQGVTNVCMLHKTLEH